MKTDQQLDNDYHWDRLGTAAAASKKSRNTGRNTYYCAQIDSDHHLD